MTRSRPGQRALRRGRVSLQAQIYLVTTVTAGRTPIFHDLYCGRIVVGELRRLASEERASTLAFSVMPDHLHWLMQLQAVALGEALALLKGRSARTLNVRLQSRREIWQPGFHDHAVRSEENLPAIARYIVANPVRAGLVRRVGDYPLWDCAWL